MSTDNESGDDEVLLEKTIVLRQPVSFGKDKNKITLEELKLREPTAGELDMYFQKQAKTAGTAAFTYLIAAVTGVEEPLIKKISSTDFKEAIRFLVPFVNLEDVFPITGAN